MERLRILIPTLHFFTGIYRDNSLPTSEYYAISRQFGHLSRLIMAFGYVSYLSMFGMFLLGGVFDFCRTGFKSQILHIYIPGIYHYSAAGTTLLAILNTLTLIWCGMLVSPPDMLFYLSFGNVPMVSAIIHQQMKALSARLRLDKGDPKIRERFLQYVGIHHKYNE